LTEYDAGVLTAEKPIAEYFESAVKSEMENVSPKTLANWMTGDLFSLMNQTNITVADLKVQPEALAELVGLVTVGEINQSTGKTVLSEMFQSGKNASEIVEIRGLKQVSDESLISDLVKQVMDENPDEVESFKAGKETVVNWLFGQVMRKAAGKANPQVVRAELERQLRE
jgi:aspartyl-tRNA(Asn)/glutamyl-tRNA(Gln) amidotransferase subunit B